MIILILFAFLAGIVTVLSPCILPVLPLILANSFDNDKKKPIGIVTGFIFSFTFFTLFLTTIVKTLGISPNLLRSFSIIIILIFGVGYLIPAFQTYLEKLFSLFSKYSPKSANKGFLGGFIIGLSIGLLWTPCVGPILASVIALALTGSVDGGSILITLFYALGTVVPMLLIIFGGQKVLSKVPNLGQRTGQIQKMFGVIMILTSLAIYFNLDRQFQNYIIQKFPNYGAGLIKIEDNKSVKNELDKLNEKLSTPSYNSEKQGKPSFIMTDEALLAPEIISGGGWINLPNGKNSLNLKELRGKVVLVDFWTYTCINCIRTLPYIKSWDDKYRDKGLVIIGVHTPEFEFEKDLKNVSKAVVDFGLKYPIVQDNNYATWKAYKNHYWPAKYLIDRNGKIRDTHFGEGGYDKTESEIQLLLKETGADISDMPINNPDYQIEAKTPETYLGYTRIENFTSPERIGREISTIYSKPTVLPSNGLAYEGEWTIGSEYASPSNGSKLYFNFSAKQVFLVMRPKNGSSKVKVYLNESAVRDENIGDDVKDGIITVDSDRLYKLINLQKPGRNTLILEFLENNIEVFAFTFG